MHDDDLFFAEPSRAASSRLTSWAALALTACFVMLALLVSQAQAAPDTASPVKTALLRPNDVNSGSLLLAEARCPQSTVPFSELLSVQPLFEGPGDHLDDLSHSGHQPLYQRRIQHLRCCHLHAVPHVE